MVDKHSDLPDLVSTSDSEDYDEDFFYDDDSPELQRISALVKVWTQLHGITCISNGSEGDILANAFEKWVRETHPDAAKSVKRDALIYYAVLEDWCP